MEKRAFSGSSQSPVTKIDTTLILETSKKANRMLLASFDGVPLVIDGKLKGNQWYCGISPELYVEIKKREMANVQNSGACLQSEVR